jgi:hypothetical protein
MWEGRKRGIAERGMRAERKGGEKSEKRRGKVDVGGKEEEKMRQGRKSWEVRKRWGGGKGD